ncbi:MAG: TonB family protein [Saprospiraceae bacterium]|nr:TonB family protein [Saprospiraceae bacterium]
MLGILYRFFKNSVSDWNNMVFSNRNRAYGAYQLRLFYNRNMTIGLILSLIIFLACLIIPSIHWNFTKESEMITEVFLENPPDIVLPKLNTKMSSKQVPESPKKNPEKKPPELKKSEIKKVVKEEIPINEINTTNKDLDSIQQKDLNKVNNNAQIANESEVTFDFVDVMPQYPGGSSNLSRFISSKLVYPNTAFQNKVEGVVVVGFVIDKEGNVRNPKILKSLYPSCDEEALRVIRLIPIWIPAKNNNRNVSFNFKMPIEFKLNR